MRRFLTLGCQEPSLLCCPAEAASPPPISAFQRSSSFSTGVTSTNLLQSPLSFSAANKAADQLFTNIERQISAKIAFIDPLLLTAKGGGGGGDNIDGSNDEINNDHQESPLTTTISQQQQERPINNNNISHNLFNFSNKDEQKNKKINAVREPTNPSQKGLDSFFAALANANDNEQKKQEKSSPQQNQLICGVPSTAQFNNLSQNNSSTTTTTTFSSSNNSNNFIDNSLSNSKTSNNLVVSTQHNLSTAIANAAVNIVNAAFAVQQQQTQQQQQQQQLAALQFAAQSAAASLPLSPQQGLNAQVGAFLNQLSSPNISKPLAKPIPLLEDKVDLMRFKRKEPREWSDDDVIAWILDVARRHRIPCENMNLTKFAKCTGPLLMLMNEQSFKEQDPNYGSLLFGEFCKLVTDETFIDEWMRINGPSCSDSINDYNQRRHSSTIRENPQNFKSQQPPLSLPSKQQQQQEPLNTINKTNNVGNLFMANLALKLSGTQTSDSTSQQGLLLAAAGIAANQQQQQQHYHHHQQQQQRLTGPLPHHLGQLLSPTVGPSSLIALQQQQQQITSTEDNNIHVPAPIHLSQRQQINSSINNILQQQPGGSQQHLGGKLCIKGIKLNQRNLKEQKIRRNKDGRPRKRSQHTKGNKLWEFIRDALKDPRTCPSIVRWEDPSEGVFRIVESERLAFLWGQKKNNQKMTYEKLSRAMRTYYEKEILVPVPKSGLYPKKLVYKFGPSAMGWKMAASFAVQTHLIIPNNSNDISSQQFYNLHQQQQQQQLNRL
ncbi:hypothetical protein Mgra_00000951 [Meloidogyne graminicola]|uniref:ETS domain-containing protein n=1 Tax=Meloidogyne graminicola TaxID=189291 RepID=A0A8T0A2U8_9BILA|nr:hypothetical protein Mgra_00000951 [Meloidogyne graminicola]